MNDLTESIRLGLDRLGELTEVILNAISLLFIIGGVIISLARAISERGRRTRSYPMHMYFRMLFGGWLVVALEFQLAADIVGTIISPNKANLIQLGAIALIRTFLNYFLTRELNEEMELSRSGFREVKKDKIDQE